MKQQIAIAEEVHGHYSSVPALLRLESEFDRIVREPLEELRVPVGGGYLGRRVVAEVGQPQVGGRCVGVPLGTLEIPVRWRAAEHPALFPTMRGALRFRDVDHDRIEAGLEGEYRPPFGVVGAIVHRAFGNRAARVSLEQCLHRVATELAARLAEHSPPLPRGRVPSQAFQRAP